MLPIKDLAAKSGLKMSELSLYGNYMAKISLDALKRRQAKKDGKLILVSAINPTPAGEGKSTTTIGLVDAMNKLGKKCVVQLGNRLWVLFLALKVVLLVAAMRK